MLFRSKSPFVLGAILLLSGCASSVASLAPLPPLPPGITSEYRLGGGDEIRVFVYGLDAMNNTFMITDRGMLTLPLIKPVRAAGLTVSELEKAISDNLLAEAVVKQPNVNVQPVTLRPFYILGEVNKPGEYPYRNGLTVLSAVSIAGGYTFRAEQRYMAVTRQVNGREITGRVDAAAPIQPGDTVRVDEKWF